MQGNGRATDFKCFSATNYRINKSRSLSRDFHAAIFIRIRMGRIEEVQINIK